MKPGLPIALVVLLAAAAPAHAARTLYTTGLSNTVAALAVGPGSALTPIGGTLPTGMLPESPVVTPDGRYLFVANALSASISRYAIAADGTLTALPAQATVVTPVGLALAPDGSRLYVAGSAEARTYAVGADGVLTAVGPPTTLARQGIAMLVAPDARTVYMTDNDGVTGTTDRIAAFAVASDGSLISPPAFAGAGDRPSAATLTADGRFLYAANFNSDDVSGFAIGAGGALTPLPGFPITVGGEPGTVVASPAAALLAVVEQTTNTTRTFAVGAAGALTPVGTPQTIVAAPSALAFTPSGRSLFTSVGASGSLSRFDVGPDGTLTSAGANATTPSGGADVAGTVVSPDQGPAAAFGASAAAAGAASAFDATSSSDPDGRVARYDWDFGDGTTAADAGPVPRHAYAAAGTYTVTLTVTDDEGCSTTRTFTGKTVACNGGPAARTSAAVAVPAPPPPLAAPAAPKAPAPAARTCLSRRTFTAASLGVRKRERITRVVVLQGRKTVRTLKPKRSSVTVDLRGLTKAKYTLRVTVKRGTKTRTIRRTYNTCTPRKPA